MKESFKCQICRKNIVNRGSFKTLKYHDDMMALCCLVGYSEGGWGDRQDHTNLSLDEICRECFDVFIEHIEKALKAIEEAKDSHKKECPTCKKEI